MTYEEAFKKAKELKPNIDACDEYDKGFVFKTKSDEWSIGGDPPCVILKSSGDAINQVEFFDMHNPKFIRTFDL